jgi:hypothetical protein
VFRVVKLGIWWLERNKQLVREACRKASPMSTLAFLCGAAANHAGSST